MKYFLFLVMAFSASVSFASEQFKICGDYGVSYDEISLKLTIRSNDKNRARTILEGFALRSSVRNVDNNWIMSLSSGHSLEQKTEPTDSNTHKFFLTIPSDGIGESPVPAPGGIPCN